MPASEQSIDGGQRNALAEEREKRMTNSELNNITDDRAVDVLRDEYRLGVHEMEKKEQFI